MISGSVRSTYSRVNKKNKKIIMINRYSMSYYILMIMAFCVLFSPAVAHAQNDLVPLELSRKVSIYYAEEIFGESPARLRRKGDMGVEQRVVKNMKVGR